MRFAREGLPFIAGFLLAGVLVTTLAYALGLKGVGSALAGSPFAALGLFSAWFFRDPDRAAPSGEGVVLAPADGRIVAVRESEAGPSLAIFLNVFDVHVNRAPVAGSVKEVAYRRGGFRAAFDERAGEENERNDLVLSSDAGEVRVRQIAGLIARRIVCRVRPGDRLAAGERFGLIRFGSRTDLRLPPGGEIFVQVGDRVRGGETIVGRMPRGLP